MYGTETYNLAHQLTSRPFLYSIGLYELIIDTQLDRILERDIKVV